MEIILDPLSTCLWLLNVLCASSIQEGSFNAGIFGVFEFTARICGFSAALCHCRFSRFAFAFSFNAPALMFSFSSLSLCDLISLM